MLWLDPKNNSQDPFSATPGKNLFMKLFVTVFQTGKLNGTGPVVWRGERVGKTTRFKLTNKRKRLQW